MISERFFLLRPIPYMRYIVRNANMLMSVWDAPRSGHRPRGEEDAQEDDEQSA